MRIPIIAQSVLVAIQLLAGAAFTALGSISGFVHFALALLIALGLGLYLRVYRVHAAMRGLQLVFTPGGVTYMSDSGAFTAPWAAVKRVRLRRDRWISVRVPHWGGPIDSFGPGGELIMPLQDTGLGWHDIRGAVTCISNGAVTPH